MQKVNKDMLISEVLQVNSAFAPILMASGMHCLGCPSSQMESLEDACSVHDINANELVNKLNEYLETLETV